MRPLRGAAAHPVTTALLTLGHGTLSQDALGALLSGAGVRRLVDVRRFPASRTSPHVHREELERWLPGSGTAYRWEPRLGGRRRLPSGEPVLDPWWTVEAFRAYAAHTRTPEFRAALADLRGDVERDGTVAVMCSESVWWRCHRRLVADVPVLGEGLGVEHLLHDGRRQPHPPAAGARRTPDGLVRWDDG